MSRRLINRSNDLQRLESEGYELNVCNGYLLIEHVPYVNIHAQVAYGTLISRLELGGDITVKPRDHTVLWTGEQPCDSKGAPIQYLANQSNLHQETCPGVIARFSFSQKPTEGYENYYTKMTTYIHILEGNAQVLDPNSTARTFPVVKTTDSESVFLYEDTASSRAGITAISDKLKKGKIAIVGLGGTGSYILDYVAKTPVQEIHLFDGDKFLQHNAFRTPGAFTVGDLETKSTKVAMMARVYSRTRRNIIPHEMFLSTDSVGDLACMDFVFLCLDNGESKRSIVKFLTESKILFVDVGMGLFIQDESVSGLIRVTTSLPERSDHLDTRITYSDIGDGAYSQNIQIAELNALNAALAVIKWKKIWGFYADSESELNTVYGITTNMVTNDKS